MARIHSIIDVYTEGEMEHKKRHHRHSRKTHHHSEAVSDKNRLFHTTRTERGGIKQTTNVEVNIGQGEGCFEGLVKAIGKCFGRG